MSRAPLARLSRLSGGLRRHAKFLRFLVAAGASVPVNIGARIVFSRWLPYEVAVLLSHLVGMVTAYVLTRLFVFGASGGSVRGELGRFAVVNVVSAALTWCVSVALVYRVFPAIGFTYRPEIVAHVLGLGVASVSSFVGHNRFSFRKPG
jgi:putative flippase GtrA